MADDELPYGVSHGRGVAHVKAAAKSSGPSAPDSDEVPKGESAAASDGGDEDASIRATARERRKARGWIEFGPSKD